jgi:hypothetical protein
METILEVPPMCQYDAVAPLLDVFNDKPVNAEPYAAILPPKSLIAEVNGRNAYRAKDSARLNFTREDAVPDAILNDILWHELMGRKAPKPAVRYSLSDHPRKGDDD